MTQTNRQPETVWNTPYWEGSKARHAEAEALGKLLSSESITLESVDEVVVARVKKLVEDGDAAAAARYAEVVAERNALEAKLASAGDSSALNAEIASLKGQISTFAAQKAEVGADITELRTTLERIERLLK